MIGFLRTWTLNIVMVVIFISFIEMLLPSSSMKKYVKMVVGLLVILVIITPIIELVHGDINIQDEIFKSSMTIEKEVLSKDALEFQGAQDQQMISMYKHKITEHLRNKLTFEHNVELKDIDVIIDENKDSKEFGKIKKIHLSISEGNLDSNNTGKIMPVDNISIEVNSGQSKPLSKNDEDSYMISDIKNSISRFYDVDKDNINISMNKTSH